MKLLLAAEEHGLCVGKSRLSRPRGQGRRDTVKASPKQSFIIHIPDQLARAGADA